MVWDSRDPLNERDCYLGAPDLRDPNHGDPNQPFAMSCGG